MKLALRRFKRRLRHLRKSAVNAYRGFQPTNAGYPLAIRRVGELDIAHRKGSADERVIEDTFGSDVFALVPEYAPGQEDVILDIGAHIGTFALVAAKRVPVGSVYAVEASQESFNYLRINKGLNELPNIYPEHVALAGEAGTIRLYHDLTDGNWGHSVTAELSSTFETARAETLGGFLGSRSIDRCSFAKFNCEGAEFPILLNTSAQDLRRIGAMLILYHSDLAPGYSLPDLVAHLQSAGFHTRFIGRKSTRGRLVAVRASI